MKMIIVFDVFFIRGVIVCKLCNFCKMFFVWLCLFNLLIGSVFICLFVYFFSSLFSFVFICDKCYYRFDGIIIVIGKFFFV